MGYHGQFTRDVLDRIGLPQCLFHPAGIEFYGSVNLLKGGLVFSDYLTTVSRSMRKRFNRGYGTRAGWSARSRADRLVGI